MESTRKIAIGEGVSVVDVATALYHGLPKNHVANSVRVVVVSNAGLGSVYGSEISLPIGTMANANGKYSRTVPVPVHTEDGPTDEVYLTYALEPASK